MHAVAPHRLPYSVLKAAPGNRWQLCRTGGHAEPHSVRATGNNSVPVRRKRPERAERPQERTAIDASAQPSNEAASRSWRGSGTGPRRRTVPSWRPPEEGKGPPLYHAPRPNGRGRSAAEAPFLAGTAD